MPTLTLKPTHKPVKSYYAALDRFAQLDVSHESAVRAAFQTLLEHCARQCGWTLVPEHAISPQRNRRIVVDGALIDDFRLTHGYWEAKDIDDDLPAEVERKFAAGYPRDNILFQNAAAGAAVAERAVGAGRRPDGRGEADRDVADVLRLPPAGVRGVGGGGRPVQRQGGRHRQRPGRVDPEGAAEQPPLHRRLRRVSGQMPPVDQPQIWPRPRSRRC